MFGRGRLLFGGLGWHGLLPSGSCRPEKGIIGAIVHPALGAEQVPDASGAGFGRDGTLLPTLVAELALFWHGTLGGCCFRHCAVQGLGCPLPSLSGCSCRALSGCSGMGQCRGLCCGAGPSFKAAVGAWCSQHWLQGGSTARDQWPMLLEPVLPGWLICQGAGVALGSLFTAEPGERKADAAGEVLVDL